MRRSWYCGVAIRNCRQEIETLAPLRKIEAKRGVETKRGGTEKVGVNAQTWGRKLIVRLVTRRWGWQWFGLKWWWSKWGYWYDRYERYGRY